jgi:hypothetical protein
MSLHVYEHRYVEMTRRCLEGSSRFGMVPQSAADVCGTEVEIIECEELPGGRFYLEVVGVRVFHIKGGTVSDEGLLTAEVQYLCCDEENFDPMEFDDAGGDEGAAGTKEKGADEWSQDKRNIEKAKDIEALYARWQHLATSQVFALQTNPALLRYYRDIGPIPPLGKPSARALWCAALINPTTQTGFSGLAKDIRVPMLSAPNTAERLYIVEKALRNSIEDLNPRLPNRISRVLRIIVYKLFRFIWGYSWLIALGWYAQERFGKRLN